MLTRLKLTHKIVLAVSVLMTFELLVFASIFGIAQDAGKYVSGDNKVEKTITLVESLKSARRDAARRVAEFSLTRDPASIDSFKESVKSILVLTRQLKQHLASQKDVYNDLSNVEIKLVALDSVAGRVTQQVLSGDKTRYKVNQYRVIKLTQEIDQSLDTIVSGQSKMVLSNAARLSSIVHLLQKTILVGVVINVLVAFIITFAIIRHLKLRVDRLSENAALMIKGEKQLDTMRGDDEFSNLDRVYHHAQAILDETRRKHNILIDNASEVVCQVDQGFAFSTVSPVSLKTWGYSPIELNGLRLLKIVHPDDRKSTWMSFEQAKASGEVITFNSRIMTKVGLAKDMCWTVQWSSNEKVFSCVGRDITREREAQRGRQKVLDVIGHDLKVPLSSVHQALGQLSQLDCLPLPSRRTLSKARASINEMLWLTNDLINSEKVKTTSVDLKKTGFTKPEVHPEVPELFVSNG